MNWRKSSYSGGAHQNCVEVANSLDKVKIRDSRHPHLGHLSLPVAEWRAFLGDLRDGQL